MNCRRVAFVFVPLALIMGCSQQDASRSRDASPSRAASSAGGPTPRAERDSTDFAIVKLDPALDAIVSPDAMLETIGDRFGLTEGPVWVQDDASGHLLFSDLIANVIYRWNPGGELSVFLENIYDGPDILNVGQQTRRGRMHVIIIGANGLTLDREGRLIIASPASRAVFRLEKDGKRTVVADRYEGKRFNGPNDVVVKSNGSIYFTDGNSGYAVARTALSASFRSTWIWLFSSTDSTSARSGGLRYNPTISRTLSMNSGSFDSLKVSTRCGCRANAFQSFIWKLRFLRTCTVSTLCHGRL